MGEIVIGSDKVIAFSGNSRTEYREFKNYSEAREKATELAAANQVVLLVNYEETEIFEAWTAYGAKHLVGKE